MKGRKEGERRRREGGGGRRSGQGDGMLECS